MRRPRRSTIPCESGGRTGSRPVSPSRTTSSSEQKRSCSTQRTGRASVPTAPSSSSAGRMRWTRSGNDSGARTPSTRAERSPYAEGVTGTRFARAIEAIDAANADDPNRLVVRGVQRPKELAHAELVTEWLQKLDPDASEALLLAGRAHHIKRWTIPRSSYPEGRSGYLRWRRALHEVHADVGYDSAVVDRVRDLVRKRGLGRDPDAQAIEDALCLVFIETQLLDLAARLDHDKVVDVVAKTMRKMSDRGIELAGTIDLPAPAKELLTESAARR